MSTRQKPGLTSGPRSVPSEEFSIPLNPLIQSVILLMEEILHQLRLVAYPIIHRVSYISGAGFLNHQQYFMNTSEAFWRGNSQVPNIRPQQTEMNWVFLWVTRQTGRTSSKRMIFSPLKRLDSMAMNCAYGQDQMNWSSCF